MWQFVQESHPATVYVREPDGKWLKTLPATTAGSVCVLVMPIVGFILEVVWEAIKLSDNIHSHQNVMSANILFPPPCILGSAVPTESPTSAKCHCIDHREHSNCPFIDPLFSKWTCMWHVLLHFLVHGCHRNNTDQDLVEPWCLLKENLSPLICIRDNCALADSNKVK